MRIIFATGLAFALNSGTLSAQQSGGSGASFVERFDRVNPARWYISDGWANDNQNCAWSAQNLRIADGGLELILKQLPQKAEEQGKLPFTCAEIQTHDAFGYGAYEVRMRAAAGPGLVSAFFTYIGPRPDAPAPHDEIDFEFLGKDRHAVQLNYFGSAQGGHENMAQLGFDASTQTADYAFEWLPDTIRWYINGKLVREVTREEGKPFPGTPSKIMLSLWSGQNLDAWLGKFAYPGQPLVARYELVAFTKAGEPCQFPESIVCKRRGQASLEPSRQSQR